MNDKLKEQVKSILTQMFKAHTIIYIKFINENNKIIMRSKFGYSISYTFIISNKYFKMTNGKQVPIGSSYVNILINIDENLRYINESLKNTCINTTTTFINNDKYYFFNNTLIHINDIKKVNIERNLVLLNKK